jgi:hypothetical protein
VGRGDLGPKLRVLNILVLLCNWVKVNYNGNNATIKQDEYGFTLVNFGSLIPISNQSFAFPLHVKQKKFLIVIQGKEVESGSSKRSLWEKSNKKHLG